LPRLLGQVRGELIEGLALIALVSGVVDRA
jgi:hypothetical protein